MRAPLPRWLPDGTLMIPLRAESDDGMVGDGWDVIGPWSEEWATWLAYMESIGEPQP